MHNPLPPNTIGNSFAFPYQCNMLKLVGAWPLSMSLPLNYLGQIYYIWSFIVIILIGLTCLAQSMFVYYAWGDILTVTECGCTVLMGLHNLLRLIHLNVKRNSLKILITEFVQNIWISKKHNKYVAIKCEKGMVILKIVSLMLFLLICMYVTLPLLELTFTDLHPNSKPFPYKMVFPYDTNNNIRAYAITYVLTSFAGFGVVTTLFAEDSLFGFFVEYTCGQFLILNENIDKMIIKTKSKQLKYYSNSIAELNTNKQQASHYQLKRIIIHHNIIIRFAQHLETFFAPILLINFTISSLLICMVGFQIAIVKMTIGNYAKLLIYIVSALSQLFILCAKGDKLIEHSTNIAWKLYDCNWQGTADNAKQFRIGIDFPVDISFMKDLCFAIRRAQKPLTITALKFSVLSLKSFTAILSTSLSYFTLLKTLVEES